MLTIAALIVAVAYGLLPTRASAQPAPLPDACERWKSSEVLLRGPFERQGARGYFVTVLSLRSEADSNERPARSPVRLCEDGKLIGMPHSLHDDVRGKGGGLFSHWLDGFLFSTPDNTDPNSNGRRYTLVAPPR